MKPHHKKKTLRRVFSRFLGSFRNLVTLIIVFLACGCERDPTVARWRLVFDSGWTAAGVYRSDFGRVSYSSLRWIGFDPKSGDSSVVGFAVKVGDFTYFIAEYDPDMLRSIGFKVRRSEEDRDAWIVWSREFANGSVYLSYDHETHNLVRATINFKNSGQLNMAEFGFFSNSSLIVDSALSEQDAISVFGPEFDKFSDRYLEF